MAQAPPNYNGIDLRLINFDNHPIFKIHNWTKVVWTNVPNILDHLIFVSLGCMHNFRFIGRVEVRKKDGLRVGGFAQDLEQVEEDSCR